VQTTAPKRLPILVPGFCQRAIRRGRGWLGGLSRANAHLQL